MNLLSSADSVNNFANKMQFQCDYSTQSYIGHAIMITREWMEILFEYDLYSMTVNGCSQPMALLGSMLM